MKPPPVAYARPTELEEALALLAAHGDDAKVLAGGQSLVPLLSLRLAFPAVLVDVTGVAGLEAVEEAGDGRVRLGAATTHSAVEDGRTPDPSGGLLPRVAHGIGYRAIRNRGTLGGSLAHADSSAEWPVVMAALDAAVRVRSATADRRVPVRELYTGFFLTTLAPEEVVTAVEVPAQPAGRTWGFDKQARKVGEFADSLAVAAVDRADGTVTAATVWLGAAAEVPVEVPAVTDCVSGRPWDDRVRAEVRAAVADALPAPTDAEGRYRTHLHGVAACRALQDALERQEPT